MKLKMELKTPMHDFLPIKWKEDISRESMDYIPFRNLSHFKDYINSVNQREDNKCGVSYAQALQDLNSEAVIYSKTEYESIRNLVRANLLKQGLISEDIYESFKYSNEGVIVDISKVILEDPECFLTPVKSYTNHFYELFVSISYNCNVEDETVRKNAIKLLSTIEELERQHIYIKVTLVFAANKSNRENDLLVIIPLFSFRDFKSIETMSAVVNERLLRKFMFALMEDIYGENLDIGYGRAIQLEEVLNIGNNLSEIDLFTSILDQVVTEGSR